MDGQVVDQEGRPGEAGGTGIQERGSGGIQEAEKFASGLGVEEEVEEGWWVQCQQDLGCGETVTGEMEEDGGHRETED